MKATLDLPDELIRAVKLCAVMQRRTVKDLVADFMRRGLGTDPPRDRKSNGVSGGMADTGCRSQSPISHRQASRFAKNPSELHPGHCLMPGEWPSAATLRASDTSIPLTSGGSSRFARARIYQAMC